MDLGNLASLNYFLPELLLTVGVIVLIVVDLIVRNKASLGDIALIITAGALVLIAIEPAQRGAWLFHRMLVFDAFGFFFRALIALAALVAVWMSIGSVEVRNCDQGEYYAILLASTLGMFLMAEATNLLMAYLALEFVSLTSYILTGFLRRNRRSQEAALKYLIYGGVASGTMVYGMSWIFGIAGSLDFGAINSALSGSPRSIAAIWAVRKNSSSARRFGRPVRMSVRARSSDLFRESRMASSSRVFSTKLICSFVARVAALVSSFIKLSTSSFGSTPASLRSATSLMARIWVWLSAIAVVRNCFAELITECSCCETSMATSSSAPRDPT